MDPPRPRPRPPRPPPPALPEALKKIVDAFDNNNKTRIVELKSGKSPSEQYAEETMKQYYNHHHPGGPTKIKLVNRRATEFMVYCIDNNEAKARHIILNTGESNNDTTLGKKDNNDDNNKKTLYNQYIFRAFYYKAEDKHGQLKLDDLLNWMEIPINNPPGFKVEPYTEQIDGDYRNLYVNITFDKSIPFKLGMHVLMYVARKHQSWYKKKNYQSYVDTIRYYIHWLSLPLSIRNFYGGFNYKYARKYKYLYDVDASILKAREVVLQDGKDIAVPESERKATEDLEEAKKNGKNIDRLKVVLEDIIEKNEKARENEIEGTSIENRANLKFSYHFRHVNKNGTHVSPEYFNIKRAAKSISFMNQVLFVAHYYEESKVKLAPVKVFSDVLGETVTKKRSWPCPDKDKKDKGGENGEKDDSPIDCAFKLESHRIPLYDGNGVETEFRNECVLFQFPEYSSEEIIPANKSGMARNYKYQLLKYFLCLYEPTCDTDQKKKYIERISALPYCYGNAISQGFDEGTCYMNSIVNCVRLNTPLYELFHGKVVDQIRDEKPKDNNMDSAEAKQNKAYDIPTTVSKHIAQYYFGSLDNNDYIDFCPYARSQTRELKKMIRKYS